jgi:hypothetical protein
MLNFMIPYGLLESPLFPCFLHPYPQIPGLESHHMTFVSSPRRIPQPKFVYKAIDFKHWHKGFGAKMFTGEGQQLRGFERGRGDIFWSYV